MTDPAFRPAQPDEIRQWFGAEAGSLGPVGVTNMTILADQALAGRRNMIAGANRNDRHLRHVTLGGDFQTEVCDLRQVATGDGCVQCGGPLPPAIAPFQVVVTPANYADPAKKEAAERIYRECLALGLDARLDDRDERPGVKFKDADLIGVPFRITVGKKLPGGMVELVERSTKTSADVPVGDAAQTMASRLVCPVTSLVRSRPLTADWVGRQKRLPQKNASPGAPPPGNGSLRSFQRPTQYGHTR